jgi:hypothetical protein
MRLISLTSMAASLLWRSEVRPSPLPRSAWSFLSLRKQRPQSVFVVSFLLCSVALDLMTDFSFFFSHSLLLTSSFTAPHSPLCVNSVYLLDTTAILSSEVTAESPQAAALSAFLRSFIFPTVPTCRCHSRRPTETPVSSQSSEYFVCATFLLVH